MSPSKSNRPGHSQPAVCDLCGLPLSAQGVMEHRQGHTYRFCCNGCRQVFRMLMASDEGADPADFKNSELFQRCQQMGIIPSTLADLEKKSAGTASAPDPPVSDAAPQDSLQELALQVNGMWCPACAWVIGETLQRQPGVSQAACNFSTDRLRVQYDPLRVDPPQLLKTIQKLGYAAQPTDAADTSRQNRRHWVELIVSGVLTMHVMMLSLALYTGAFENLSGSAVQKIGWPMAVMTLMVGAVGGRSILRKGWQALIARAPSMESLIAIGFVAAVGYSLVNLWRGSWHLYFDTACMLITLVLVGKTIEQSVRARVQGDLQNLFSLQPSKVRLVTPEVPRGRLVALGQLRIGDLFKAGPDEIVPADGTVLEGMAQVNAATLTGEARPLVKSAGDFVLSGMRLLSGDLTIRATAVGNEATLGQMITITEAALEGETPVQSLIDRFLPWFVPLICALSLVTVSGWLAAGQPFSEAFTRGLTVLVISCPCALGVAIPLARVAGVSVGLRQGLLIHDPKVFERASLIDAVVFDKTGTLTRGEWRLRRIVTVDGLSPDKVLSLAAGLEADANHTVAHEVLRSAHERQIEPREIDRIVVSERCVRGSYQGLSVAIGALDALDLEPADLEKVFAHADMKAIHGQSRVAMTLDGKPVALLAFDDRIHERSRPTVATLAQQGFQLALLSGDNQAVTQHMAVRMGISAFEGDRTPVQKAAFVQTLQAHGRRVAMVGDGINDAPALAQSDLAIAVRSLSGLENTVAGVTLMHPDPARVVDFLTMAKQVNRIIRQNLSGSFAYNIVGIPLAMAGLLNPLFAVCAMLLSSLSVTLNSARLRSYKPLKKARPSIE